MTPCLSDSALAEFVQGVSTAAEAQAIEAHVAQCSACRQLVSQLSELLLAGPDTSAGASPRTQAPSPSTTGPARRRRPRFGWALAALAGVAAVAVVALLVLRARPTPTATPPPPAATLAVLEDGAAWSDVAVAELLRAVLGDGTGVSVVDGDTCARVARELGPSSAGGLTAARARAWQRRLGVTRLVLVTTSDAAGGPIAVEVALWPAVASPLRGSSEAGVLPALATRLDAGVRAAWRWPARSAAAASLDATVLPPGEAMVLYAEGLRLHRQNDEAGAIAAWGRAAELAPEAALPAVALAEALAATGQTQAAAGAAARALAATAKLPPPPRRTLEARARLMAGQPAAVLALLDGGMPAPPALLLAVAEAQRARGDAAGAAATLARLRARGPLLVDEALALALADGRLALAAGDGAAARAAAQKVAGDAGAVGAATLLAASRRLESAGWLAAGDVAQARATAGDAVAAAVRAGEAVEELDALLALGVAQAAAGTGGPAADDAGAARSFARAVAGAGSQRRLDRLGRGLGNLAALAARAGRRDEAARWLDQLAETARQAGQPEAAAAARRERAALLAR